MIDPSDVAWAVRSSRDISVVLKRIGAARRQSADFMKIGGVFNVKLEFDVGFAESDLLFLALAGGERKRSS